MVGEIPGWPATSTCSDLARLREHFQPVCEYRDAPKTPKGLLDISTEAVGKQKVEKQSKLLHCMTFVMRSNDWYRKGITAQQGTKED